VCTELRRLGAGDPEAQAADLVSISDGVVFDRLVGVRSIVVPAPGTAESVEELGARRPQLSARIFGADGRCRADAQGALRQFSRTLSVAPVMLTG
jgi:hypothetical protein